MKARRFPLWAGLLLAALVLGGLAGLAVFYARLPENLSQHETLVLGQSRWAPGSEALVRVLVRDGSTGKPLANASVEAQLQPADKVVFSGVTDATGTALVRLKVPADAAAIERLQLVADILGKSVVLAQYESKVSQSFERIEPFAANLEKRSPAGRQARELLRYIGSVMLSEHNMVGRVEVAEKPDLLWERPELERLYLRLQDEFEINDRHAALERKLELISRTAHTVLELLQNRRNLRVEWYIVILIVFEIILSLYEMFFRRG